MSRINQSERECTRQNMTVLKTRYMLNHFKKEIPHHPTGSEPAASHHVNGIRNHVQADLSSGLSMMK